MATQNFGHLAMLHNRYQQYQSLEWIDSHLVSPYQVVLIVLHGFIARGVTLLTPVELSATRIKSLIDGFDLDP